MSAPRPSQPRRWQPLLLKGLLALLLGGGVSAALVARSVLHRSEDALRRVPPSLVRYKLRAGVPVTLGAAAREGVGLLTAPAEARDGLTLDDPTEGGGGAATLVATAGGLLLYRGSPDPLSGALPPPRLYSHLDGLSSVSLRAAAALPGNRVVLGDSEGGLTLLQRDRATALRLDLSVRATEEGPQASASPSSRPAPRAAQDPPSLAGVGSSLGAIAQPRLLLMAPAPTSDSQAERPTPREAARAEHLLVFVVDALRADRVLPDARRGGHPRPFPALTQLLRSWAALRATSPGNFPLPAHASLLSGTYPAVHRMVRDDTTLPDSVPLLAETLRRADARMFEDKRSSRGQSGPA